MIEGKKLTDHTNSLSHHNFKKNVDKSLSYLMMNKSDSIEATDKTNLTNQTKFWLREISKIENYFHEEIDQRKSCSEN